MKFVASFPCPVWINKVQSWSLSSLSFGKSKIWTWLGLDFENAWNLENNIQHAESWKTRKIPDWVWLIYSSEWKCNIPQMWERNKASNWYQGLDSSTHLGRITDVCRWLTLAGLSNQLWYNPITQWLMFHALLIRLAASNPKSRHGTFLPAKQSKCCHLVSHRSVLLKPVVLFVQGGLGKTAGAVKALSFDISGTTLWCGDNKVIILHTTATAMASVVSFLCALISPRDPYSHSYSMWHQVEFKELSGQTHSLLCFYHLRSMYVGCRYVVCPGHPITCISNRSWMTREARDPSLLVNARQDALMLFR